MLQRDGGSRLRSAKSVLWAGAAFAALWAGMTDPVRAGEAGAARPALEALLRAPQYADMELSPDGKRIAALVPLEDRTVIALMHAADFSVERILDPGHEAFMESVTWASDERLYAHVSFQWGTRTQPYALGSMIGVDVDGRNRSLFDASIVDALVDDPDYVLVRTCKKALIRGCITQLTRMRNDGLKSEAVVEGPVPNAVFRTDHRGEVRFSWATDDDDMQKLFVRKDGAWALINDEAVSGVEISPLGMSADGRSAYLRSERVEGPDVIERMEVATGRRVVVAEHPALDPESVVWSFDGREPIGVRYGLEVATIRFFDDAHPHAVLMRELEGAFPGEQVRVTSRSRSGALAIAWVHSDREPGRYYLLDTQSGDLRLLARSRPWLDARAIGRTASVSIMARDGVALDGYLTLPVGLSEPPLVVLVHGGPFGIRDEWHYDTETQILASQGYAVLRVNFRGSSGRGRSFVASGYRRWGREMQDDITDATRWAMREASIAPGRVCIWGSSYGGYAALMGAVREPDLYRCAIGVAAPYDLPTLYKWGDVQRSRYGKAWLKLSLGDDEEALRDRSPTAHAGDIKAQLMLVQGGRDPRVSPEHAKAMRRALDRAGKAYEGYFPSQETHSFYDEGNRAEYYARVLAFLRANLAQEPALPRDGKEP